MATVKANNSAVGEGLAPPVYHTLARQQPLGEAFILAFPKGSFAVFALFSFATFLFQKKSTEKST